MNTAPPTLVNASDLRRLVRQGQAWLNYLAHRAGPIGLASLGLAMLALVFTWLSSTLQTRVSDLQAEVAAISAARLRDAQRSPGSEGGGDVAVLLAELPEDRELPLFLEELNEGAGRVGLQIERAEYRAPVSLGGPLVRTQLVLPMTGRYPSLVQWMVRLLKDYPSVAVDELSVQRTAPGSDQLKIRVTLSHYSRSGP